MVLVTLGQQHYFKMRKKDIKVLIFTCEFGALTTCGWAPEDGTVPVRGKFLLVTDAQDEVCQRYDHYKYNKTYIIKTIINITVI